MLDPQDHSTALAVFIAKKTEFDTTLARRTDLSSAHFNSTPDEITWGHVGALSSYLERLRHVGDAAFNEGEHLG